MRTFDLRQPQEPQSRGAAPQRGSAGRGALAGAPANSIRQLRQARQIAQLHASSASRALPVQLRRAPPEGEMREHIRTCHNDGMNPAERTPEIVRANWQTSHGAGLRVMQKGVAWLNGAADALPSLTTGETAEALSEKRYKTFWKKDSDGGVELRTHRGEEVDDLEAGAVDTFELGDDQDYFYSNEYRGKTGEFMASVNYGSSDTDAAKEAGLPETARNSEIIWHQYALGLAALRQQGAAPRTLRNITRNQISNTQTLDTIFMCDEGAAAQEEQRVDLREPTDDAIALLGTPNGSSAAYVLIQHGHEFGGQDIESISYSKDFLDFRYLIG